MKQNIIIFLLTVICAILGYMAAEMKQQDHETVEQTAAATASDTEFKAIPYKEEPDRLPESVIDEIADGGYINLPMPPYPRSSIENEEEGTVRIEITVESNGQISSAKIIKSSGYSRLDAAALRAARGALIRPKIIDGQPVRSKFVTPFIFKLSP